MFDIAWTEILIVAVIAILVVGPKELPGMLRAFGRTFGQVRRTAREFQSTFNDALREAERSAKLDEVRKDIDSVRSIDPTAEVRKGLDEAKSTLSGKVGEGRTDTGSGGATAGTSAEAGKTSSEVVPLKGDKTTDPPSDAGSSGDDTSDTPRAAAGGERR